MTDKIALEIVDQQQGEPIKSKAKRKAEARAVYDEIVRPARAIFEAIREPAALIRDEILAIIYEEECAEAIAKRDAKELK